MIWRASATSANTMADRNCEPGEIVMLFSVTGITASMARELGQLQCDLLTLRTASGQKYLIRKTG